MLPCQVFAWEDSGSRRDSAVASLHSDHLDRFSMERRLCAKILCVTLGLQTEAVPSSQERGTTKLAPGRL